MPSLANNLSVANDEFDQVVMIQRNHGGVRFRDYRVSKPKQGDFNRRVRSGESMSLFGDKSHINIAQQFLCVKNVSKFDNASYETVKVKFQQIYRRRQDKERQNKGALQSKAPTYPQLFKDYATAKKFQKK
jgi:hypothetical protein